MTQAFLPAELCKLGIDVMAPGDHGWTVPWALMLDDARLLWLRTDFTWGKCKAGTRKLHIQREDDVDGVQFWIATLYGEYKWTRDNQACCHFVDLGLAVPLTEFHHQTERVRARPFAGRS